VIALLFVLSYAVLYYCSRVIMTRYAITGADYMVNSCLHGKNVHGVAPRDLVLNVFLGCFRVHSTMHKTAKKTV